MLDLPCCCDHAAAMCNDQHALDGVVTVRFSTTVIADGLELAGWLERSIGPQGGCWDIMLDMEADTLSCGGLPATSIACCSSLPGDTGWHDHAIPPASSG